MTAFKDWMYKRYEVGVTCKYTKLQASGGDFNTLANHRVDAIRRPGDKEQFCKERATDQQRTKGAPGTPGKSLDAERQCLHQSESEEWQGYSHRCDEEIRFREGRTPSPITYYLSLPAKATPGAPTKKTIMWAEYQSRLPRDDQDQIRKKEEAEWCEKMKQQQEELEFRQGKLDRLKREQEELVLEQECLRAGQEQLNRLRAEQECLRAQAQATARSQMPFGSHTPVQDEHGEDLDYYDDLEQEQRSADTW